MTYKHCLLFHFGYKVTSFKNNADNWENEQNCFEFKFSNSN